MENSPKSSKKTIIIIVVVLVVVCCLCTAIAAAAAGGLTLFRSQSNLNFPIPIPGLATPTEVEPTEELPTWEPEDTEVPYEEPTDVVLDEPTVEVQSDSETLGISRSDMIDYLGGEEVFSYEDPFELEGNEIVMGQHSWICIDSDCATVTMLGPEEDLQVVSIAVPTDPKDQTQTMTALALMMNVAIVFTENEEDLPTQIMTDVMSAQSAGTSLEKTVNNNGYKFLYTYDPSTRVAGLAVSR